MRCESNESPDNTQKNRSRGTLTTAGRDSPYRGRSVEENLALLDAMRYDGVLAKEQGGFYPVLRAKIDMASSNMNLRDPALYRVKISSHPRTAGPQGRFPRASHRRFAQKWAFRGSEWARWLRRVSVRQWYQIQRAPPNSSSPSHLV